MMVQRSVVPLVMAAWLIIGGVLLALGNPTMMSQAFALLVPLTLVAMGVWAIVRAMLSQQVEQRLQRGVLWSEALFALMLLLVYGGVRAAPLASGFAMTVVPMREVIPTAMPPMLVTPLEQLPKQPRLVIVRQLHQRPLQLDIAGGDRFEADPSQVQAMALNHEVIRLELSETAAPIRLTVPKRAELEVDGRNFLRLNVREMDGNVRITYGGQNPIVTVAAQGDITVRQVPPQVHYRVVIGDELTLFPGPNSRIQVKADSETVRIYAHQPPQRGWDVNVTTGRIEARLPAKSSIRLCATRHGGGAMQIPFGQGQRRYHIVKMIRNGRPVQIRSGAGYYEHIGTLGGGKVPINFRIGYGDIVVELAQ